MKTFLATYGTLTLTMMLYVIFVHIFDPLPANAPGLRYLYLQLFILIFSAVIYGGIHSLRVNK